MLGCIPSTFLFAALYIAIRMPWCWISSFCASGGGDGSKGSRFRLQVRCPENMPGEPQTRHRLDVQLPQPSWFRQLAQDSGLDSFGGSAPNKPNTTRGGGCGSGATIIGLARVSEGACYTGVLTNLSAQAQLQQDAFFGANDAFVMKVEEAWVLEIPWQVTLCADVARGRHKAHSVEHGRRQAFLPGEPVPRNAMFRHAFGVNGGGAPADPAAKCTIAYVLLASVDMTLEQHDFEPLPCFQICSPIAELACAGQWRDIMWLARWKIPSHSSWWPEFPPRSWLKDWDDCSADDPKLHRWGTRGSNGACLDDRWQGAVGKFSEIANNLRQWAPGIISQEARGGADNAAEAEITLIGFVEFLQTCQQHFPGSAADGADGYWRGFRHSLEKRLRAEKMVNAIQCFMLMRHLKSQQRLPVMLTQAANLLLPGIGTRLAPLAGVSTGKQQRTGIQFSMDLAWMELRKEQWSPDTRTYGWADASPQAGREWFLSQNTEVDVTQAANIWQSANFLASARALLKKSRHEKGEGSDGEGLGELKDDKEIEVSIDLETSKRERLWLRQAPMLSAKSIVKADKDRAAAAAVFAAAAVARDGHRHMGSQSVEDEFLAAAARADETILDGVRLHVNPPMALGLGKAHLVDKTAALMFAWFLETPSMDALKKKANHCVSFTTDMGTELGLAAFMPTDMAKLLPHWMATSAQDFECDVDVVVGIGSGPGGTGGCAPVPAVALLRLPPQCQSDMIDLNTTARHHHAHVHSSSSSSGASVVVSSIDIAADYGFECDCDMGLCADADADVIMKAQDFGFDEDFGCSRQAFSETACAGCESAGVMQNSQNAEAAATACVAGGSAPSASASGGNGRGRQGNGTEYSQSQALQQPQLIAAAPAAHPERKLLERAISVPGLLHICHNLLQDIDTNLTHWNTFWPHAKNAEALLICRHRRERLLAICFRKDNKCTPVAKRVQNWSSTIHEQRWGDIINFLIEARPVLVSLRSRWNESSYLAGHANEDGEEGNLDPNMGDASNEDVRRARASFNPRMFTQMLQSNKWFMYLDLVLAIHRVPDCMGHWAEACACHGGKKKKIRVERATANSEFLERPCPLKGCRLPEMACGALVKIAHNALKNCYAELLNGKHFLSDEDWSDIIVDYESARAHVLFALHVKTDFCKRLPWRLAGLATASCPPDDESEVKRCFRDCARDFDTLSLPLQEQSHFVTKLFLTGSFRKELDQWSDSPGSGLMRANLSASLQSEIALLSFIPVVERSVERLHSHVNWASKHAKAKRGSTVSMAIRWPGIYEAIHQRPSVLENLATAYSRTVCISQMPIICRVAQHPLLLHLEEEAQQKIPEGQGRKAKPRSVQISKALECIVYRCDIDSQFVDLTSLEKQHLTATKKSKKAVEHAQRQGSVPCKDGGSAPSKHQSAAAVADALPLTGDAVIGNAFLEHFKSLWTQAGGLSSQGLITKGKQKKPASATLFPKSLFPDCGADGATNAEEMGEVLSSHGRGNVVFSIPVALLPNAFHVAAQLGPPGQGNSSLSPAMIANGTAHSSVEIQSHDKFDRVSISTSRAQPETRQTEATSGSASNSQEQKIAAPPVSREQLVAQEGLATQAHAVARAAAEEAVAGKKPMHFSEP